MKIKFLLLLSLLFAITDGFAQQLPYGTCGIVNVYDAAGNRTKRVYFCNNSDPYPSKNGAATEPETFEYQLVDALYPNPTTAAFSVTFSKALVNASVSVIDNNGKTITRFNASGNQVNFDLSAQAAGIYFVRIEENGKIITRKVLKQ